MDDLPPPNQHLPPPRAVKASDLGSHFTHLCDLRLKLNFSLRPEAATYFNENEPEQKVKKRK
jgi:hypothetical protein